MISIVVYGRNDNHGYNLHKRAAISLNCLAETLRDPDDELIFVDYNSPDELPTFPEAIADTLTTQARAVLRIFRVRPTIHGRYTARTNLLALEPIARNVGIRRSNPANRWILSTNTDIILVLRQAADLSGLVGDLPAGWYHTARFEIPESLWEAFDRTDPRHTIEEVHALGRSARLNEVVYGSPTILFDGPGDFQLVERAVLFDIDGFDERMLRGWHVDSNLAKRLALKCSPAGSLLEQVYCYHCDHTRQATFVHKPDSIANDPERFVTGITRPDLPDQRHCWGCADDIIEEIRLGNPRTTGYRRALQSLVAPLDRDFTETYYTTATYDRCDYDPQHVLPFLADLLNHLPRDVRLAWCGLRGDMFELVRELWGALGFCRPIAVHHSVAEYLLPTSRAQAESRAHHDWLTEADLFGFEFGRRGPRNMDEGMVIGAGEAPPRGIVEAVFAAAVEHERLRRVANPTALPRRFIGVDCIHNHMEEVFGAHIGATLTPFGSRLRHGFVAPSVADEVDPDTAARLRIGHALGLGRLISRQEFDFAQTLFAPLLAGGTIAADDRHRAACHASLGQAFLAAAGNPRGTRPAPDMVEGAMAVLETLRPSAGLAAKLGIAVHDQLPPGTAQRALSRFAGGEDWDDPAWSAFARYYGANPEENLAYRRDASRWERVHLLYGLDRAGIPADTARVLVVATMPDAAIAGMSRWARRVEVFGLASQAAGDDAGQDRVFWCNSASYDPASLTVLPAGTRVEMLEREAYDAVVFPHGAMFGGGLEVALAWIRAAEAVLRPNGILAFKAEIAAGSRPHADYFDVRAVGDQGLAARLTASTGFSVEGFDPYLSRATVDKVWPQAGPTAAEHYFLSRQDGRVLIPSYWFLTKRGTTVGAGWDRMRQWLLGRWYGEQTARLQVGSAGHRRDDGRIVCLPGEKGHVFFGPYLAVPDGRYCVTLLMEKNGVTGWIFSRATVEAVVNGTIIARARLGRAAWRGGIVALDFEVRRPAGAAEDSILEIRLHSPGGVSLIVASVDLQMSEAYGLAHWPLLPPVSERAVAADPAVGSAEETAKTAGASAHRDSPKAGTGAFEPEFDGGARSISRIAAWEDWDDPAWSQFLPPASPGGAGERDVGVWERTDLLYGLDRCGKLLKSTRVLVAATMPDEVIALLSEDVGRVEVLDLTCASELRGPEARLYWTNGALYARDRLAVHEPASGLDGLDEGAYDVIAFPHGSLFFGGIAGIARLMATAERLLATGGVLVFKAEILAGIEPDLDHLDMSLVGEAGLAAKIEAETGFAVEGGFDPRLSPLIAAGMEPDSRTDPRTAALVREHRDRLAVPSLWFLRKRGQGPEGGWRRVEEWLLRRVLGDQIDRLHVGPAGHRDGAGRILTNDSAKGRVFFGPYLGLPGGRYEAAIGIETPATARRGRLRLDVVTGGTRLQRQDVKLVRGAHLTVRLPFTVASPSENGNGKIEIRAWRKSGEATFTECRVSAEG
jgi:hypothetical protein